MCLQKMMSWADSYVLLCECANYGSKRIPISPRIEQNLSPLSAAAERGCTHSKKAQPKKFIASVRCGVGFGPRLKLAPFRQDYIDHGNFYAATAWPVTRLRQDGDRKIRWRFVVIGRRHPDAARGRATAARRRPSRRLYRGPPCARSDHTHSRRHHPLPPLDDRRRLRGRQ